MPRTRNLRMLAAPFFIGRVADPVDHIFRVAKKNVRDPIQFPAGRKSTPRRPTTRTPARRSDLPVVGIMVVQFCECRDPEGVPD